MSPRQVLLEVERKFTRFRLHPLKANGGSPPFSSLVSLGTRQFRDIYFDHGQLLSRAGMWVRLRDGKWQCKIKQGGNFNDSQFQEIEDEDEINRSVQKITKIGGTPLNHFGLSKLADISTTRDAWMADNHFKIVYDKTDFGHTVGEVELENLVDIARNPDLDSLTKAMDDEIVDFLDRYHWAFDCTNPIGKLTAYFAQGRRKCL